MVDKIDKTTLKILLFIVFLVILYLIVNRKTQIKEGFFLTDEQKKINYNEKFYNEFLKVFETSYEAWNNKNGGVIYQYGYWRTDGDGNHGNVNHGNCYKHGREPEARKDASTNLTTEIDNFRSKTFKDRFGFIQQKSDIDDFKKILKKQFNDEVYDKHGDIDKIIVASRLKNATPFRSGSSNFQYYVFPVMRTKYCHGKAWVNEIWYNEKKITTDSLLFTRIEEKLAPDTSVADAALEKKKTVIQSYIDTLTQLSGATAKVTLKFNSDKTSVTGSPEAVRIEMHNYLTSLIDNVDDLEKAVSDVIDGYIKTAKTDAKTDAKNTAAALVITTNKDKATALNLSRENLIQSYLDLLVSNSITLTYKQAGDIIGALDFSNINDTLEKNLYTAMKDYYTGTITQHHMVSRHHISNDGDTIDSCESPKIGGNSLSEEECKKFREDNVGKPGEPVMEYGGYPMSTGTFKETTGDKDFRFLEKNNYISIWPNSRNTAALGFAKGCQYRNASNAAVKGIYYMPDDPRFDTQSNIHLLCKGITNYIEDAVQALLLRKESQTIANRFIEVLNTGGILEDIKTNIVNYANSYSVKAAIENIVKELNIISILPAEDNKDCTDFKKYSLNKEECEKYSQNNKPGTTVTTDDGTSLNLINGTSPTQYFYEIDTSHYPKGCSIRVTDNFAGIKFSTTPLTTTSNISKQYSVCKKYDYDIVKLNQYIDELTSLSSLNGGKYKLEYEMLDALIKLLEGIGAGAGITTTEIETNSNIIQDFIQTNTEEKLKEFEEKEHNTMMKSHGFF